MERIGSHPDLLDTMFWLFIFTSGLWLSYGALAGLCVIAQDYGIVGWSEWQMAGYSMVTAAVFSATLATIWTAGIPKRLKLWLGI